MIKTIIKISLFTLILILLSSIQSQAGNIQKVELDSNNILSDSNMEITLNNNIVNSTVVRQDSTLYIDSNFFADYFGTDEETKKTVKNSVTFVGTLENQNGEKVIYLPMFTVLKALGVRYTYSPLYDKEIVRMRTDNEFKVYKAYTPQETSEVSYGNTPHTPPAENTTNTECAISNNGYPSINYSMPVDYGYRYPANYEPGYYFGTYGFVGQGNAPANYYTNNYPVNNGPVDSVQVQQSPSSLTHTNKY